MEYLELCIAISPYQTEEKVQLVLYLLLMYLKLHLFGCVQLYVLGSVQYTMFVCTVFTNVCMKTCFE